jgi:hypothetical protein
VFVRQHFYNADMKRQDGPDPNITVTIVFTEMTKLWRRGVGVALCLLLCSVFADGFS